MDGEREGGVCVCMCVCIVSVFVCDALMIREELTVLPCRVCLCASA